jgi:outer membrane protein assembly factor BamB
MFHAAFAQSRFVRRPRVAAWATAIALGLLCLTFVSWRLWPTGLQAADPRPISPEASAAQKRQPADESGRGGGAPNWPNWRGPGGQGIARQTRLPEKWPDGQLKPRWRARLGAGWSSPVVDDQRVFITDRLDDRERVLAFDADDGHELWTHEDPVDFMPHAVGARHGTGPKSTPALAHGRVYSLGIAGRLLCLDAKRGKVVWQIHLPERYGAHERLPGGRAFVKGTQSVIVPIGGGDGAPVPLFGYTGSLLVAGKLVVCPVGGARGGTIMAFDADTGDEVWRSLDEHVSYSSPVLATFDGQQQVVVMTGPEVVGLDLASGRKLWGHPFQIQYDESISTPAVEPPYVAITGDGHPLTAMRIERRGEGWSADVAWTSPELSSYLSSMLAHAGHVYGMNDGGEIACLRMADGNKRWIGGNHGYYCTPVLAGRQLLCLNEKGELLVLAATPEAFTPLATVSLAGRATWTSPAVAGSRLYVRCEEELRAFDLAPSDGGAE